MAFGDGISLIDDFNRANEGPPLSASWTSISNGCKVSSNTAVGNVAGAANADVYETIAGGADVEAYFTLTTKGGLNDRVSVFARMTTLVGATTDGYEVRANPLTATDTMRIYRVDNGVSTQLATVDQEMASGEKLGIQCQGSTIKAFHYTGGAWNERLSTTDSTYASAGYFGLSIMDTAPVVDDFYGGEISAGGGVVGPLIGGHLVKRGILQGRLVR